MKGVMLAHNLQVTIPMDLLEDIQRFARDEEVSFQAAVIAFLEDGRNSAESPLARFGIRADARSFDALQELYHDDS
jgi:hypothetical protein